MSYEFVTKL